MKGPNIDVDYVSIRQAANIIDVSDNTIKRWYKWWENDEFEKPSDLYLPPYVYKDKRKTKYFKKSDLEALQLFSVKLRTTHFGCMSEFNAGYQWGKRGKRALNNKNINFSDVQHKMK